MQEKRFYINSELFKNKKVIIEGEDVHHLANAIRARVGDKACLFNGNGN